LIYTLVRRAGAAIGHPQLTPHICAGRARNCAGKRRGFGANSIAASLA
jgi:hypothetical protein